MIMTDQRKSMNPDNFDTLLFLKYSKCRWNINTVQALLNEKKKLPPPLLLTQLLPLQFLPLLLLKLLPLPRKVQVLLQDENDEESVCFLVVGDVWVNIAIIAVLGGA
jgi:hypothetical protein